MFNMIKKIQCLLLIAVLCLGAYIPTAFADKILFFSPTRVTLSDKDKVEVINISNLSDIARAYKISFQDLVMTKDGVTTPVENFEYSSKRMMRFVPREFVLQPGERQTVRIMARVKPDTPAGEYHTHVRFLEDVSQRNEINEPKEGEGASIAAPLAYEALIPAVLSHGDVTTTLGMKNVRTSKVAENGHVKIDLDITRSGNGQGLAFVDTDYVTPNGSVTPATPRRTIYIYRELDERSKDYDFALKENIPAGTKLKVTLYDSPSEDAQPVQDLVVDIP